MQLSFTDKKCRSSILVFTDKSAFRIRLAGLVGPSREGFILQPPAPFNKHKEELKPELNSAGGWVPAQKYVLSLAVVFLP